MSRSLNKAIIIGNLGSDPEVRAIASGARVANFSVATSRSWTGKDGQQQEKTEWHRIVAWDKLADIAERFLKKGEKVYVEGEIEYRQYEDKDGVTKYITEIRAREMMMLGGRGEGAGGGGDFGGGRESDFGGGGGGGGGARPSRERAPAASGGPGGRGSPGGAPKKKEPDYDDFKSDFPEDDDLPF